MKTFNSNLIPTKEFEYQTGKLKEEDIIITINNSNIKEKDKKDEESNLEIENLSNLNINEEQSKKSERLKKKKKKNIDSSSEYKSILSHLTYQSMASQSQNSMNDNKKFNKKNKNNIHSENNSLFGASSDEEINDDDESLVIEYYQEIRNCILNKEYSRVNEIKNIINNNEINLRKKKHEKKLEKLIDLEAQLTKSSGNYIIQNNDDKDFILANIDPYKGYEIITMNDLQKNFQLKKFKDYEYYIDKPI